MSNRPVIAFFNNKGGVGKTSLVYHLAWMYGDMGYRVVAADLDPQANLTAFFLDEDELSDLFERDDDAGTIYRAIKPVISGRGDLVDPVLHHADSRIALLPGDLALALLEDELSQVWPVAMSGRNERPFLVLSAIWRVIQSAAGKHDADLVLADLGPNLGALNRTALLASTHVVVPLAMDLFSLQGLRNLGELRREWVRDWADRLARKPASVADLNLPPGTMVPAGYIVMQYGQRLGRPVKAYARWAAQIPGEYRRSMLEDQAAGGIGIEDDPHCLGQVKHHRSLMPLAQEARKPIFRLTAADGAMGAHATAARESALRYAGLAERLAMAARIGPPASG